MSGRDFSIKSSSGKKKARLECMMGPVSHLLLKINLLYYNLGPTCSHASNTAPGIDMSVCWLVEH